MSEPIVKQPIAIVGMACRLPGADNIAEYWQLLANGVDATSEFPAERLDRELYYSPEKGVRGKTYSTRGGMIPDRPLDLSRVPLTADDLRDSDPCHQILCEVAADAWLDAGNDPFGSKVSRTGVYVGHSGGSPLGGDLSYASLAEETVDYLRDVEAFGALPGDVQQKVINAVVQSLRARRPKRDDYLREVGASAAAELVARVLKLSGPQMSIDAACASSLVALSLSVIALQLGEIDSAIVAGASYNKCDSLILFSHAQSCSAGGSRPFDENADGLISAEGYVALVIKTLDRAKADGDRIHAVIRGIGMSSDGRGRSLWAPRKEGQVQAMRRAYESGVDPTRVEYIEAHATSTQVGDATEVEALREFFRTVVSDRRIPIGSVKSNIGHTLETAGLAGLIKSVLAMRHSLVPASINVRSLNREIPWKDLPFFVAREPIAWPRTKPQPRRAAVNAFGIGGLNVHVVVDEYDAAWNYASESVAPPAQPISNDEPIAIIGRGLILPGAASTAELAELLKTGRSQISEAPEGRWRRKIGVAAGPAARYRSPHARGGFITNYEYDWRKFKIPPKQVAQANPLQFMLLDAARQALEEAGYQQREFDRAKVSVVVGSSFGSEFGNQLQVGLRLPEMQRDIAAELRRVGLSPEKCQAIVDDVSQRLLDAKPALLDETGSFTASTLASRVSKTLDLMGGAMAIDSGDCSAFAALEAACGILRSRVCDMVLCAGASRSMDLPSFELSALNGCLEGSGPSKNPFRKPVHPGEGVAMLLLKRLSDAQRDGDKVIGIIRGVHATNLLVEPPASDEPAYRDPLIEQIGDTLSAQGLVSIVSAVTAKSSNVATVSGVSSIGLKYDAEIIVGSQLPVAPPKPQAQPEPARASTPSLVTANEFRIIRVSGENMEALKAKLASITASQLRHKSEAFTNVDTVRLAIVAGDEKSLATKLELAKSQLANSAARAALEEQGIYFGRPTKTRVAFLFPGQGSQYPEMLSGLAQASPAARRIIEDADRTFAQAARESFETMVWGEALKLGHDVWTTQAAMLVADMMMHAALAERGITADVVCGHSYGEFAAMVAAGCWSVDQALRATMVRAKAIDSSCSGHGGLVSLDAAAERVEPWLTQIHGRVFLTHYNAPEQTVVGGDERSLAEFSALASAEGVTPRLLPVPSAFHTPLLADTQEPLRRALEVESLLLPRVQLLSSVTNRYVSQPAELRENLVAQMVAPVRWMQLVERLASEGTNVFIEVGPQQVLARLTRQVLAGQDILVLATDHPRRDAREMLLRVEAALEVFSAAKQSPLSSSASPATAYSFHPTATQDRPAVMHEIEHFDATARRREKKRTGQTQILAPAARIEVRPVEQFDATSARRGAKRGDAQRIQPTIAPLIANVSAPVEPVAAESTSHDPSQLERFLIDFVVEQTGYPAEMIDLDWDMEADLGIDSIKRAQLFGELREFFEFEQPGKGSSFTLDQFRTLRQVIEFLHTVPGKGQWLTKSNANPAGVAEPSPSTAKINGHATPIAAPLPAKSETNDLDRKELEQFLIDFVVEQTGYPPEIVELDADLEADLGIDSIKKAQLFGELREQFTLPVENMSRLKLAEFRTLRQVLDVLEDLRGTPSEASVPQFSPPYEETPSSEPAFTVSESAIEPPAAESHEVVAMKAWLRNRADERWTEADVARLATIKGLRSGHSEAQRIAETSGVHVGNVVAYHHLAEKHSSGNGNGHGNGHETVSGAVDDLLAEQATIASRYTLRMVESPQKFGSAAQPKWTGAAVILGNNEEAHAIRERLERDGCTAFILTPVGDPIAAANELERLWQAGPITHLFITTPRDRDAATTLDERAWQTRRANGIMTPFWVCQRWIKLVTEAGLMDQATLAALVSLGGDFGLSSNVAAAESGAVAGLLKAIIIESWVNGYRTIPVKIIDSPVGTNVRSLIDALWRELAVPSYDCEIGLISGRRHVVRAEKQDAQLIEHTPIRPGSVWICTGGARGITAYVANELAKPFKLKLHLIGTAPVPDFPTSWRDLDEDGTKRLKLEVMQKGRAAGLNPVKAWQNTEKAIEIDKTLRDFAAQGISARYHSCDVSDRGALARVLEQIRKTDGAIDGILHGAGIGKDSRFDRKDPEKVDQCFKAKIDGTLALMDLTRRDPIKHFIGFGSISGRFGANGHTDYSAANDMLCKLIDWYRAQRPDVSAVAFHWHAWGDVGMATKPETRLALELVDMQFMPAREGLAHLVRELAAKTPCGEVLITDDRYHRMFYPAETLSSEGPAKFPLLDDGQTKTTSSGQLTELTLDPTSEVFLVEHRLEDRPLLPVVIGMELLAEAARKLAGEKKVVALHNVEALNGLRFFNDRLQQVRVAARHSGSGRVACELTADFLSRDGKLIETNRGYLRGEIELASEPTTRFGQAPSLDESSWQTIDYAERGSKFYLGPPLRACKKIRVGERVLWGKIYPPMLQELAGKKRSADGWIVPSAALDACLYAVGMLAWMQVRPGPSLPLRFGKIALGRLPHPGEACLVEVKFAGQQDRFADFHFTLFGSSGDVILQTSDYRIVYLA